MGTDIRVVYEKFESEDIATVLAHHVELFESLYEDEGEVRLVFGFDC